MALSLLIVFGLVALILGVLIRLGKLQHVRGGLWVGVYRNSTSPWGKHKFFTLAPSGAAIVLLACSVIAFEADARGAGWALLVAAAAAFAVAVYVGFTGPSWAKPRWLQEEDTARRRRAEGE